MQLPKNILQIGQPDEAHRIYIEDYVYTYLKQFEQEQTIGRKKIYLFGKSLLDNQISYLYIYGAAESEKGVLSIQHEFFPDYDIIGILSMLHGEKEISLQNGTAFCLNGFFVFYEQNAAMQNFLVNSYREKQRDEEQDAIQDNYECKEAVKREISEDKKHDNIRKDAYDAPESRFLYIATFSMAIVICIIAITTINRYDKMMGFQEDVLQAAQMASQNEDTYLLEQSNEYNADKSEEYMATESDAGSSAQNEQEQSTESADSAFGEETSAYEPETFEQENMSETSKDEDVFNNTAQEQVYIVRKGDTLAGISRQIYGTDDKIAIICKENAIDNPDDIIPGQKLVLP